MKQLNWLPFNCKIGYFPLLHWWGETINLVCSFLFGVWNFRIFTVNQITTITVSLVFQQWMKIKLCHLMTKPITWHVRPAKTQISLGIHSVWSELAVGSVEALGPKLPREHTAKTLIRLGGCPGWSESSLGAQVMLLVLSCTGSNEVLKHFTGHYSIRVLFINIQSGSGNILIIL